MQQLLLSSKFINGTKDRQKILGSRKELHTAFISKRIQIAKFLSHRGGTKYTELKLVVIEK